MKIIDVEAAGLSSWTFARIDAVVTLIILVIFALLSMVGSNIRVLCLLLGLVTCGAATLSAMAFNYETWQLPVATWLFLQSLSLYTVYLSFQTIFFERFIACFHIRGNVGFFIITLDFVGYMGTVLVLVCKECFGRDIDWLDFYNGMSGCVGLVCGVAFAASACVRHVRSALRAFSLRGVIYLTSSSLAVSGAFWRSYRRSSPSMVRSCTLPL